MKTYENPIKNILKTIKTLSKPMKTYENHIKNQLKPIKTY